VRAHGLPGTAALYLEAALDVIIQGRRVAKWCIVHRYFLKDPRELALFDTLRGQLEGNLEELHGLIEGRAVAQLLVEEGEGFDLAHPADDSGRPVAVAARDPGPATAGATVEYRLHAHRMRVTALATATAKFMKRMVEGVEDGLLHGA
jgi:hypothetical protein